MLKDRKIWRILRKLEIDSGTDSPISFDEFAKAVLDQNLDTLVVDLNFKDSSEVRRTFKSLVQDGYALFKDVVINNESAEGVTTNPSGDKYFEKRFSPFFWNLYLEDIGYWKVVGLMIALLSFVPNGVAYKLIELIEKIAR